MIVSNLGEYESNGSAVSSHSRLTVDSEVHCVFSVPCGERGVFTDVGGLVREAERVEGDGGVFKSRRPSSHCCVLEGDAVPEGRGHGHTQGGIGNRHVLLSAVDQFLPRYLEKEVWITCNTGYFRGVEVAVKLRVFSALSYLQCCFWHRAVCIPIQCLQ